jgi:hypothetical protein
MNDKEIYKMLEGVTPHFFGLGFVQCKINEKERIHFYHPDLKPTVNSLEEIHNHRYDFVSRIIKGTIHNKMYHFFDGKHNTHYKQSESCNEAIKIEDNPKEFGYISLFSDLVHKANETYSMNHMNFHTVETDFCITYLRRTPYKKEFADVVRPIDGEIVCPFEKKLSQDECWTIIKECMEMK